MIEMKTKTDLAIKGAALLLIATLSWGAMFPIAKAALSLLDGFYLSALRYGIASVIFVAILIAAEGRAALSLQGRVWGVLLFGSAGFAGFSILAFVGLAYSNAEHAAILMALMPLITALINWAWRGMKPNKVTLWCIAAALAGVFMVITKGHPALLSKGGTIFGDILIFLGATCWVIYTIGANIVATDWSPLRYTALSAVLGTLTIFAVTMVATVAGYIHVPPLATIQSVAPELAYLIVIAGVIAVLSWNAGIKKLGALNGILFVNLVPITAFTIGLAQGHTFSTVELMGAAVTISALVVNNINARRTAARAAAQQEGARG